MGTNIAAIIPARGGSKGIPRKNLKMLAGRPLVVHTIEAARACNSIGKVAVSTEDAEIAQVSRDAGAEVIERPPELALDDTPTEPVLIHAVEELEKSGYSPDIVVLLQPTSPLRGAGYIRKALAELSSGYDSVLSLHEATLFTWDRNGEGFVPRYEKRERRQDADPVFIENGAIYATKKHILMDQKNRIGGRVGAVIMDEVDAVDIDTPFDFFLCEKILEWKDEQG